MDAQPILVTARVVHAAEKVLAAMADNFVLVGDSTKTRGSPHQYLPPRRRGHPRSPRVRVRQAKTLLQPHKSELRHSDKKDAPSSPKGEITSSTTGFDTFPEPGILNDRVTSLAGVLEHSLFFNMAHKAITAGPDGIVVYTKP